MKDITKLLSIHIPLALVITFLGYLVFGAIPGVTLTGDLIAWLMELPVILIFALVAVGLAVAVMNITGANIQNDKRDELINEAKMGNRFAFYILILETTTWLAVLALFARFFFPQR